MNRKYNPWISMIALIVLILMIVTICTGCKPTTAEAAKVYRRFTTEHPETFITIITDNETGIQYLAYRTTHGTGLTKLEVAEDGN